METPLTLTQIKERVKDLLEVSQKLHLPGCSAMGITFVFLHDLDDKNITEGFPTMDLDKWTDSNPTKNGCPFVNVSLDSVGRVKIEYRSTFVKR